MEVQITVPHNSKMAAVIREYPDIYLDDDTEGQNVYFVGKSMDEDETETDFLTYDEAVACCGFVTGSIPESHVMIEGNGEWAQGMISREDFSGYAVSEEVKSEHIRVSRLFWEHVKRGKAAASGRRK